jgi:hypothetical protein
MQTNKGAGKMNRIELNEMLEEAEKIKFKMRMLKHNARQEEKKIQEDDQPQTSNLIPLYIDIAEMIERWDDQIIERIKYEQSRPTPREIREYNKSGSEPDDH